MTGSAGNPPAPSSPVPSGADSTRAAPRVVHKPRRLPGDRGPAPKLALIWATFFGSGYVPVAPGTAGTLAAVPASEKGA